MRNEVKEKRMELIKEFEERSPENFERRSLIFRLLAILVFVRFLYPILSIIYQLVYNVPISALDYLMSFFPIIVIIAFSHLIYFSGARAAALLALLGGLWSLWNVIYNDEIFLLIANNTSDTFFVITSLIFICSVLIQIFTMAFINLDKKTKLYLTSMSEIHKEMVKWLKSSRQ